MFSGLRLSRWERAEGCRPAGACVVRACGGWLILTRLHPKVVDGELVFSSLCVLILHSGTAGGWLVGDCLPPLRFAPGCHRGSQMDLEGEP